MTAHFPLDRLAAALRADGVEVDILPDAQGKSARRFGDGYYMGCQAQAVHHTGSSGNFPLSDIAFIDGGQGAGFIVSNTYVWRHQRKVTLIASGPTYTEGSGGPYGIIPEGRANDVCFSHEMGGGGAPYPVTQQETMLALAYHTAMIAADVWGWPDDPFSEWRLFGHFEWTSRKWDPGGLSEWGVSNNTSWDMDLFRLDARAHQSTIPPEEDMSTAVLWRDPRYKNVFLVGAGQVINVSPKLYDHYVGMGVPSIVEQHQQLLESCLHNSGLDTNDLEPV